MYYFLTEFKKFLLEKICREIELKRIESDEYGRPIYTRVNPDVYLFDELISYNESKMPYIKIYASTQNNATEKLISITLTIFVKNDAEYSYKYDDEGNPLAEYEIKSNDELAWMDAWGIAGKVERGLINSLWYQPNQQVVEIIPRQDDYVGNGIASIDVKFDIRLPNAPVINNFLGGEYFDI